MEMNFPAIQDSCYTSSMSDWFKNLDHLLLAAIVGVVSIGVSFIGDMSRNVQQMAASIQELNVRMGQVSDTMRDHEMRIRDVEKKTTRR